MARLWISPNETSFAQRSSAAQLAGPNDGGISIGHG
jgi:hypothetical protein